MVARHDLVQDPRSRADLLLARRGTAYFSRMLAQLPEAELDGPSLRAGWSRRHVVAHVGYNARALTRLVEGARTGVPGQMYASTAERDREIDLGATLGGAALRNLHTHAAVHLSVEWRDLPEDRWLVPVLTTAGEVPVAETVRMRAREVWLHAVDLDNGARTEDLPAEVLHDLPEHWCDGADGAGAERTTSPTRAENRSST